MEQGVAIAVLCIVAGGVDAQVLAAAFALLPSSSCSASASW